MSAAPHRYNHQRGDSPDSLFVEDDHYASEHSSRRRRLALSPLNRIHYPGDGLDFRRPVMSTSAAAAPARDHTSRMNTNEGRSNAPVIDLTDEDGTGGRSQGAASTASDMATAGSSRASRLPRFGANVIDIESLIAEEEATEEEGREFDYLRGNYLALPSARPRFSSLRRPARPPSPPRDMDDIEFVEERTLSRPRTGSLAPTPAGPGAPAPRSVTPYPAGLDGPIDLTADDDEVVHLDTRQRDGVNTNRPDATAGTGTRSIPDRGFGNIGNIANFLRDQAPNFGGRLMQRLQGFAGLDGEMRAQQQAFEHFNHNHGPNSNNGGNQTHQHQHHHEHGHTHRRTGGLRTAGGARAHMDGHNLHINFGGPAPIAGAHRAVQVNVPGMMDYDMTGFDMGLPGGNRPPSPKYSPPPEPEKGFTRSPEEDEVIVCPNCGDELAMGESETKQEVWIVKACGHVSPTLTHDDPSDRVGNTDVWHIGLLRRMRGKSRENDEQEGQRQSHRCGCRAAASV